MLNVGRMAPGSHDYYLGVVVTGAEDYYLARGEEPGRWVGRGARALGLDGTVEADQPRCVLTGADPHDGGQLATHPARKVPGFDLTFRAPKSVSLLWGLSDREMAAEVATAHDAAVDAAIGYLERAAGFTRRGAGGIERVPTTGFVGAAFRHRTSRANDPLLHTHVLVANLTETTDDRVWRTLDSKALYAHARTAGFLYQTQLRHELTTRLGVSWGPVVNGYADLAGVPREWVEHFSRRRAAILEELQAGGEASARAAQVATLVTRQAKERQVSEAELRAFWRRRAAQLGINRNWTSQILDQAVPERPSTGRLYRELVSEEALTGDASTFTRRDVLRALAERLATGATVEQVEQLADAIIGHDPHQVIPLGVARGQLAVLDVIRRRDGTVVPADCGETRYTTAGLLLVEQRAIAHALNRRDVNAATVDAATTEASIRRRTLSDEQAAMVRQLTGSGHGVEVVVGKAGTGKTYALDAARAAWQAAGIRVVGVALAARAALELQDATGIPATTLTRLLARLEEGQAGSPLAPGSVLVVDEAGMVGTRTLARLLDHAQSAGVKTVLVGDPHQLPEIGAGGLFRAMTTRLDAVELADNRRQHEAWEVAALDQLRHGDPTQALAAYRQHGRLVTAETAEAVREQLVVDWWDAFDQLGATSAVMVALRRADVDDLNARARARLLAAGQLTGPKFQIDEVTFQAGDRLVCLKNDRRIGVVNGTRATITTVHPTVRTVDVTTDDGRELTLPSGYLEGGHVTHGYAITGHKAQGLTVDHTFVLGSPELYREWGYVALSRGRATNRLYVCHGGYDDEELDRHVPEAPTDPVASRAARLQRSRAQQPVSDDTLQLADRWRRLHARLHAPDIARHRELTERRERLVEDRDSLLAQLARLQGRIDSFRGRLGRWRRREDLARLEHDHRTRAGHLKRIEAGISEVDVELAGLPTGAQIGHLRDECRKATTALGQTVSERVAGYQHLCPGYLATTLGAPPDDAQGLHRWRQTAMAVERYRLRWDITDLDRPLGPEPNNPLQRDEHRFAVQILNEARRQLNRELEPDRYRRLERGLGR